MDTSSQNDPGELRQELRSDAATVTDSAKERLRSEVDARKGDAAGQAKAVSSALDKAAGELSGSPDWLQSAFRQGARSVQRFADTLERKDARQLTREIQQFAREHPGTFLGACALAGFTAARVLKAGVDSPAAPTTQRAPSAPVYNPSQPSAETSGMFTDIDGSEVPMQLYQGELP